MPFISEKNCIVWLLLFLIGICMLYPCLQFMTIVCELIWECVGLILSLIISGRDGSSFTSLADVAFIRLLKL